jgi:hypothetical protein
MVTEGMAMNGRVALLALAVAGFTAGAESGVAGARQRTTPTAMPCHGYKHAKIGGKVVCLRPGDHCAVRYKTQYRKLHFRCVGSPPRLHGGVA